MDAPLLSRIIKHKWNYIFLVPMIILYLLFTVWPITGIIAYSFFDWDGYGPLNKFVGFSNYLEAVSDPYYWNAFKNTLIFAFSHMTIEVIISLVLAVLLNLSTFRAKSVYRLLIFIPVITNTVIAGMLFNSILTPLGGTLNSVLRSLKIVNEPINFLGSQKLALPTVIGVSIWKHLGVSLVYWLAALQTVPKELYEVAEIDGASKIQRFFHITIPIVAPIGVVITLFAFKNGLFPFDIVKTMTGGGPNFTTDIVDTYIYRYAFSAEVAVTRYGFASAVGVVFSVCVIIITLFQGALGNQFKLLKKRT